MRSRAGIWPKLTRAEELLASIKAEVSLYREGNIYDAVAKYDEGSSCYVVWPTVLEEPPLRLSLLIGECAYDLRSALDQLADMLVRHAGGVPTVRTRFPIRESDRDSRGKPTPTVIDGGVTTATTAVVEAIQPYHRGDRAADHPLALLARINNIDKHRNLLLTTVGLVDGVFQLVADGRVINYTSVSGHFDNSTPLCYFAGERVEGEVIVNGYIAPVITFNEPESPGTQSVEDVLTSILGFITDTLVPFLRDHVDGLTL